MIGQIIHLGRIEGHTHPALDLSTPSPPLPPIVLVDDTIIDIFITYCLPMCSVLTPSRVRDLYSRYQSAPTTLGPDQTALVYMFLASGYARYHYFGLRGREAHGVPESARQDVAWYRHAVSTLTQWGSASFTSLRESYKSYTSVSADHRCSKCHVVLYNHSLHSADLAVRYWMDDQPSSRAGIEQKSDSCYRHMVTDRSSGLHLVSNTLCAFVSRELRIQAES